MPKDNRDRAGRMEEACHRAGSIVYKLEKITPDKNLVLKGDKVLSM